MSEGATVHTKQELNEAMKLGVQEIVVEGELAKHLKNGKRVRTIGAGTLAVLGAAIGALPFTGGISLAVAVPIAALTGLEIALIIAVVFVGLALLIALWKKYEEISFGYVDGELRLVLRKKQAAGES